MHHLVTVMSYPVYTERVFLVLRSNSCQIVEQDLNYSSSVLGNGTCEMESRE